MPFIYGIPAKKIRSHRNDVHRDFDRICVIAEERTEVGGKRFLITSDHIQAPITIHEDHVEFNPGANVVKIHVRRSVLKFLNENSLQYRHYETEEKARETALKNQKEAREK